MNNMKRPPAKNVQDLHTSGATDDRRIGGMLLDDNRLTSSQVERILALQKERGLRFGEAAQALGLISDEDIRGILSRQFHYPSLTPSQADFGRELAAVYSPFSPQVEALRALRSQLTLRWFSPNRKALAVVGAARKDGVTYTAANLAVAFSQLGERTLLIDANLREPRQHEIFNLENREGLSDLLAGKADLDVVEQTGAIEYLSILGAGTIPPNPHELLSRRAFALLLQSFASRFDVIICDTFPSLEITDSQSVAAQCGGALLVVRANHTRMNEAAALKDRFHASGTHLTGAVVNQH